jgi:N-acetylglutamate synthase-like GNAT family acetyltransferase
MRILQAHREDLDAVNQLLHGFGRPGITADYLNSRDIALQVRSDNGQLVAFAWGGFMANNTVFYIDKVACNPEWHGKGIIPKLYLELMKKAIKRGAKEGFGVIRKDKYYSASGMNALKMAFSADAYDYSFVSGQAAHLVSELGLEI